MGNREHVRLLLRRIMKGWIKMIVTPKTARTLKTVMSVLMVAMMIFSLAISAFAAPDAQKPAQEGTQNNDGTEENEGGSEVKNIQSGIAKGMENIYSIILTITIPVAVAVVGFCAFKIFTGGEKGMQEAKKTFLIAVVALAIIYLAPWLVTQVAGWFDPHDSTYGGVFDVSGK